MVLDIIIHSSTLYFKDYSDEHIYPWHKQKVRGPQKFIPFEPS